MHFNLKASYQPAGSQPQAIQELVKGLRSGDKAQTLMGVTGSGKTFTMANVIQKVERPTLIISHNKTLAAQLYAELKQFFPNNAVEYFVSYYDYYQPEAYIPSRNQYIEKDLAINDEIEKLRIRAASALLSGRRDVIVVSSVSCIYGMSDPKEFGKNMVRLKLGQTLERNELLSMLVDMLYDRDDGEFSPGTFRVRGDQVDVLLAYGEEAYRFTFFDEQIESIHRINPRTGTNIQLEKEVTIFPANLFVTSKEVMKQALYDIEEELKVCMLAFEKVGKSLEAERIQGRTLLDLEMIRELGYCTGIENYSRHFDKRSAGQRPYCLIDYFPSDYLMIIDESHVTIPQVHAMWGGDRARKDHLVKYGFRLPLAYDNRPLSFQEFETTINQVVFVSATPSKYELQHSEGVVVEQVIRPTWLLDPEIIVHPSVRQIDHLLTEITKRTARSERVLVTTLTKRMSEELTRYMIRAGVRCAYMHSEVKTLDRVEILTNLREGKIDVLIGINLLREGLDLPEVSLVAILDADKEGFLRSARSLIQTIGRARHLDGTAIMYADTMTPSMRQAIDETQRRREMQIAYNREHNTQPTAIARKEVPSPLQPKRYGLRKDRATTGATVSDDMITYKDLPTIKRLIREATLKMKRASAKYDYTAAKAHRDTLTSLQKEEKRLTTV